MNSEVARLSEAERRAIQVHRYFISEKRGFDIGERAAMEDWLRHHAAQWRAVQQSRVTEAQCEEIQKHKWIESEKAGRDLGEEAVMDWVHRHAAAWRFHDEQEA